MMINAHIRNVILFTSHLSWWSFHHISSYFIIFYHIPSYFILHYLGFGQSHRCDESPEWAIAIWAGPGHHLTQANHQVVAEDACWSRFPGRFNTWKYLKWTHQKSMTTSDYHLEWSPWVTIYQYKSKPEVRAGFCAMTGVTGGFHWPVDLVVIEKFLLCTWLRDWSILLLSIWEGPCCGWLSLWPSCGRPIWEAPGHHRIPWPFCHGACRKARVQWITFHQLVQQWWNMVLNVPTTTEIMPFSVWGTPWSPPKNPLFTPPAALPVFSSSCFLLLTLFSMTRRHHHGPFGELLLWSFNCHVWCLQPILCETYTLTSQSVYW